MCATCNRDWGGWRQENIVDLSLLDLWCMAVFFGGDVMNEGLRNNG